MLMLYVHVCCVDVCLFVWSTSAVGVKSQHALLSPRPNMLLSLTQEQHRSFLSAPNDIALQHDYTTLVMNF
jgi:hypothetical protein